MKQREGGKKNKIKLTVVMEVKIIIFLNTDSCNGSNEKKIKIDRCNGSNEKKQY